jgi:hypothetical protein
MDHFLEKYKLPDFIQYEIDNFNNTIIITETKFLITTFLKQKSSEPDSFTGEFYQIFKNN